MSAPRPSEADVEARRRAVLADLGVCEFHELVTDASMCRCGLPAVNHDTLAEQIVMGDHPHISDLLNAYADLADRDAEHEREVAPDHATDGPCQSCGRHYPPWWADHDVWNLAMGGPEATDDPGGFLCPTCFLCRATPIRGAWHVLTADRSNAQRDVAEGQRTRAEAAERALADRDAAIKALWEKWQTFDVAGNARAHWMTDLDNLRALLPRDDAAGAGGAS